MTAFHLPSLPRSAKAAQTIAKVTQRRIHQCFQSSSSFRDGSRRETAVDLLV